MYLRTFNLRYGLCEFDLFINQGDEDCVSVLELLIDCPVEEFEEEGLGDTFFVETSELTYVFSDFKISEFYEEGEFTKVICVK